jgi:hypothetical protein
MKVPCKHCCQSGSAVTLIGPPALPSLTGGYFYPYNHIINKCKFCNGTGWIDDQEMITVPRKYVKDEYFKNNKQ